MVDMHRLAQLRRMYHHICNGGKTSVDDNRRIGFPITKDALSNAIKKLENSAPTHGQADTSFPVGFQDR